MTNVRVEVPAMLVDAVRESLILLYRSTAEALHFALRARDDGRGTLEEVAQHRTRLTQLEATIGQLGWSQEPGGLDAEAELCAPREILHDALYGTLIDTGERLAVACGKSWEGEACRNRVSTAASEVIALDRLLRRVDDL